MKKIKNIFFGFILLAFLNSCGGLSDAGKILRNEKVRNTDEFLVKKKEPLTLPPDYRTLPEPGSTQVKNKKNKIKKMLGSNQEQSTLNQGSSSVEQSIINKIGK